jgi:diguanylate cyclase (GGDEF)-like protein
MSIASITAARVSELEAKVIELEARLNYDDLTGAYTRQYLFDRFATSDLAGHFLIFVDLDDFKSVNDHYGHTAGDQLLKLITGAMMKTVGEHGFVVRLAGDEFVILVDKMTDDAFADIDKSLRSAIGKATLKIGMLDVCRTASLGFKKLKRGMSMREAVALADNALLQAKAAGKNRSQSVQQRSPHLAPRLPSVDAVRHALQNNEIGYYVQPILRGSDLQIEGFEALLRWSLPSGEVLGPSQFLETMTKAYDAATRPPLSAARRTSEWAMLNKSKYISFNISEAFIMRIVQDGLGWVEELVENIPNDQIVFELLETVVDQNAKHVAHAVSKLRHRGIRVALDDFGIGYSSLERLQGLDVDFVKIDKQFVHGAAHSNRGVDLFASMVDLSHRLGAQTVVEGVETAQHLELAQQAGANFVQGYFLGLPKPITDY